MSATRQCPQCGAELPPGVMSGLCPKCLIRFSLGECPEGQSEIGDPKSALEERFRDYLLLERIARGGMGVVYKARQLSLGRTVALKMILGGHLASETDVQRFRAEAAAAASLQHPNIVAIHEVGEHEGQHYFSMDYVEGKNLAELIAEGGLPPHPVPLPPRGGEGARRAGERVNASDWPRRAARYLKTIAEAIHYAHERGILHRDLKPSNVLIDEFDQPRITDFGLAKRLVAADVRRLTPQEPGEQVGKRESEEGGAGGVSPSPGGEGRGEGGHSSDSERDQSLRTSAATELTITGQVLGSPNFMPPEQASGKRGQVGRWSDVYSLGAMLYHLVTGRAPFQCETVQETLTQVAQADPVSPRLLNPSLPRDLETVCLKCLEKEPRRRYQTALELAEELNRFLSGEAIHARPVGRPEKLWRWCRRKPVVATLGSAVIVLVIAVAIGSPIAAYRIERERQRAEAQRQHAEAEAAKGFQVAKFLEGMLRGVGPSVARGRDTTMLREILDKTSERVGKDLKDQPGVEIELRLTLALTYHDLGAYSQMESMSREALRVARLHYGNENKPVADCLANLGDALRHQGNLKLAEEALREAVRLEEKYVGGEHRVLAVALGDLAMVLHARGDLVGAEELNRRALAITRRLVGDDHPDVAKLLNNLASILQTRGELAAAEDLYRRALATLTKDLGEDHPVVATSFNNLANLLQSRGDLTGAVEMHHKDIEIKTRVLGENHPDLALSLNNFAVTLERQGKRAEAEALVREVLAMKKKLLGAEHPEVAMSLNNLAVMLRRDPTRAGQVEALHREALEIQRKRLGPENIEVAKSFSNLAGALLRQRKYAEAESLLREALEMKKKLLGSSHPEVARTLNNLAHTLQSTGKNAEAESLLREALFMLKELLGPEHPDLATPLHNLAIALYKQGKRAEAEAVMREALTMRTKLLGREHSDAVRSLSDLARMLEQQGKYNAAEPFLRDLLQIRRVRYPTDTNGIRTAAFRLARSLSASSGTGTTDVEKATERAREAEELLREFLATTRGYYAGKPESLESRLSSLAEFRYRQEQYAEAESLYREILQSRRTRLSLEHEEVVNTAASLGRVLSDWAWAERKSQSEIRNPKSEIAQRTSEAERLLRECLAIRSRGTNATHWRTADVQSRLGGALVSLAVTDPALTAEARVAKLAEAETLLLQGHEGLKQIKSTSDRKYQRDALERLVRLYEAWDSVAPNIGKSEKVAAWRKQLAYFDQATASGASGDEEDAATMAEHLGEIGAGAQFELR